MVADQDELLEAPELVDREASGLDGQFAERGSEVALERGGLSVLIVPATAKQVEEAFVDVRQDGVYTLRQSISPDRLSWNEASLVEQDKLPGRVLGGAQCRSAAA